MYKRLTLCIIYAIVLPEMTSKHIKQTLTQFIKEQAGSSGVLIGLSGGIDSTLTCSLAVEALGRERVTVLIINNIRYPKEHLASALKFAKNLGIEIILIDTDKARKAILEGLTLNSTDTRLVSSLDARLTDLILRTTAQTRGLIYLGSINGTERLTGWYPKGSLFGDYCPIGGLLKSQVQDLARYMNLPAEIVNTVSEDASRICSGCGLLEEFSGIPYKQLDVVLLGLEIGDGFRNANVPAEVVTRVMKRVENVRHKQGGFPLFPVINRPK